MKRKDYRHRLPVLVSVEKDRWVDFVDLCDREHKSASYKISEMVDEELQKNALGAGREPNPLNIKSIASAANKSIQTDLRLWIDYVHQNKDDNIMLSQIEGTGKAIVATAANYIRQNRMNKILRK